MISMGAPPYVRCAHCAIKGASVINCCISHRSLAWLSTVKRYSSPMTRTRISVWPKPVCRQGWSSTTRHPCPGSPRCGVCDRRRRNCNGCVGNHCCRPGNCLVLSTRLIQKPSITAGSIRIQRITMSSRMTVATCPPRTTERARLPTNSPSGEPAAVSPSGCQLSLSLQ